MEPDFGLAGDAAEAFVQLADRLEADVPCHDLPGMVYRQNGEVIVNGGRCASAFTTPPRLEELDMQKYAQAGFGIGILTKLGSFASSHPRLRRPRAMRQHGVSFGPSTRWSGCAGHAAALRAPQGLLH